MPSFPETTSAVGKPDGSPVPAQKKGSQTGPTSGAANKP